MLSCTNVSQLILRRGRSRNQPIRSVTAILSIASVLMCWICLDHPCAAEERSSTQLDRREIDQPNIVILLADDLGYGELGCQGNPEIPTPHIDSIADQGIRFTQAYVAGPNCSPSRASLMTGRIPTRFGYEFNPIGARNEDPSIGLPASEQTIAQMLHDRGYTTGLIGKWHLGGAAAYHPHRRGFDEFFGFTHEGHYFVPPPFQGTLSMLRRKAIPGGGEGRWIGTDLIYSTHMGHDEPDYDANNPIIRGGQPFDESSYLTDAFTREAVSFIDRHRDKPFFLYVAYNAVHSPLQAKKSDLERVAKIKDVHRRIFAGMLVCLDDSVGQILSRIKDAGIERETWVIFLSDNGGPTRELTSSNRPLRGEKGSMYEGALRVPCLMTWPGKLPFGEVYDNPILSADLFATSATLAGAKVHQPIDGVDLMPYLLGEKQDAPHDVLYWRQGNRTALRKGNWKLVRNGGNKRSSAWELYDLEKDLSEQNDLVDKHPEILEQLKERWQELDAQMKPPLF
ncbi:MAG: sulfatase [Pirellulaceae bacterium]